MPLGICNCMKEKNGYMNILKYPYNTNHVILKSVLNFSYIKYSFECAIVFFVFFLLSMALSLFYCVTQPCDLTPCDLI